MYPFPIGLALVDLLVEHTERRVERAVHERERLDEPSLRPLPRRRSRLAFPRRERRLRPGETWI